MGRSSRTLDGVVPAAVLITRVVSRPGSPSPISPTKRVTLDLGTKAVASDPAVERRVKLLDFPDHRVVGHNEEHLVVESPDGDRFNPGDVVYALPGHVCPTVALHKELLVAEGGKIVDRWLVAARDRVLTV